MDKWDNLASQERFDRYGRISQWPMLALGLLFLVALILPLATSLNPEVANSLDIVKTVIWSIFVIDYLIRLALSPQRWQFVKTHVLDLIVIAVPFLRPLRLLRIVAILMSTTRRVGGLAVRQVILYVVGITIVLMSVSAVVVFDAEKSQGDPTISTLGDALWWSVGAVTTDGYCDVYPKSTVGRLVAAGLMVLGFALLGTLTAAVVAWFVSIVRRADAADSEDKETANFEAIVIELQALRAEVVALRSGKEGMIEP